MRDNSQHKRLIPIINPVVLFLLICLPPHLHGALRLTGKLNINSASKEEIRLLPRIGEVRAREIYNFRERHGEFTSVDSLLKIKGIGRKILSGITPYIKLSGKSDLAIVEKEAPPPSYPAFPADANILLLKNKALFDSLLKAIGGAGESIVISMFLFKTSPYPSNRANVLVDALNSAAARGVDVSILLEGGKGSGDGITVENKKSAKKLAANGIKISFDDPLKTTHTKVVVIDAKTVYLGSHNFTHSALKYNNELSVRIESRAFAGEVLEYIEGIR